MKIYWTEHAIYQLTNIYDYIATDSKFFAKKVIDNITKSTLKLSTYPKIGRVVPELNQIDLREIIYKNYRIIYRLGETQITIVSLIHSAQDFNNQYLPNI